jgi:hypothetical protein
MPLKPVPVVVMGAPRRASAASRDPRNLDVEATLPAIKPTAVRTRFVWIQPLNLTFVVCGNCVTGLAALPINDDNAIDFPDIDDKTATYCLRVNMISISTN